MKKLFAVVLAVTALASSAFAMSVEDIGKISVKADGSDFQYWNENAESLKALKAYVADVTNPDSPNFIPVADRICVSDLDGTFYSELSQVYMEWYMFFNRVYNDPTYHAIPREKAYADVCLATAKAGKYPPKLTQAKIMCSLTLSRA